MMQQATGMFKLETIFALAGNAIVTDKQKLEVIELVEFMIGGFVIPSRFEFVREICRFEILKQYPALRNENRFANSGSRILIVNEQERIIKELRVYFGTNNLSVVQFSIENRKETLG